MSAASTAAVSRRHIALVMSSLAGGGVERSMLNLAQAFAARGHRVDLVLCKATGAYRERVPAAVNVVVLRAGSELCSRLRILRADPRGAKSLLRPVLLPLKTATKFRYVEDLARYLGREKPNVLLSAMTNVNLTALWARRLSGAQTRIAVSERNTLSERVGRSGRKRLWRERLVDASPPRPTRFLYRLQTWETIRDLRFRLSSRGHRRLKWYEQRDTEDAPDWLEGLFR